MKPKLTPPIILIFLFFAAVIALLAFFTARTLIIPCATPCTPDSAYLTAVMAAKTPPAGVTLAPDAGDLGWGAVHGQVIDAVTGQPMEGVKVECLHSSLHAEYSCAGDTVTDADGRYIFAPVYFNEREYISLIFEAPGYVSLRLAEGPFVAADLPADVGLFPEGYPTETFPAPVCSPPPCENGQLACGVAEGCPGGCGTVCVEVSPTP